VGCARNFWFCLKNRRVENRQKNLRDCRGRCSDCNWFASQLEQRTFGLADGPHRSIAPPTFLSFSSSSSYFFFFFPQYSFYPRQQQQLAATKRLFWHILTQFYFFFFIRPYSK
jgi:hypothetical protein